MLCINASKVVPAGRTCHRCHAPIEGEVWYAGNAWCADFGGWAPAYYHTKCIPPNVWGELQKLARAPLGSPSTVPRKSTEQATPERDEVIA